jgi:hypothetical protein
VQLRCPANGLAQRAAVTDQRDGSYLIRYRPEVACDHEVHAWLLQRAPTTDGDPPSLTGEVIEEVVGAAVGEAVGEADEEATAMPVGGSPFMLPVRPGTLSTMMSGDIGADVGRLEVVAGTRGSIYLQLRDALGNSRPPSGESFVASLERPKHGRGADLPPELASRRETEATATAGTAAAELSSCGGGGSGGSAAGGSAGSAAGSAGGRAMRGRAGTGLALAHPDASRVEAAHSESLAAAVRAAAAAPMTSLGEHHHPLPAPEVGVADGRVNVSFSTTRAERLLLHVAVTGREVAERVNIPMRGSPFSVAVQPAPTFARRCEAFGEALHSAILRQSSSFVLLARDAHGNRRTSGGDHFIVSFRGPCNPVARVFDRGDGTYRVTYVAGVTGTCTMIITVDRQSIIGSPFRLVIEGTRAAWTPSVGSSYMRAASPMRR